MNSCVSFKTKKDIKNSRPHYRQQGFVLTLELILITTILLIGSLAGFVALRDALVKYQINQDSREVVVSDSVGQLLGPILSLDEHEAPLIPYIDRTVPIDSSEGGRNFRAIIGVRDDRFTSREPVYYDDYNCTGNAYIKIASDELSDNQGIDTIKGTGAVSYFYALQTGPVYAVGKSPDGIKGHLYRSTGVVNSFDPDQIKSRYISQKVVSGSPCEPFVVDKFEAESSCLVGVTLDNAVIDPATSLATDLVCDGCPQGYESQKDVLDLYLPAVEPLLNTILDTFIIAGIIPNLNLTIGDICCPIGTSLEEDENIVEVLLFVVLDNVFNLLGIDLIGYPLVRETLSLLGIEEGIVHCEARMTLRNAEGVPDPNDFSQNALTKFQPGFQVNQPTNTGLEDQYWEYIPPTGEN